METILFSKILTIMTLLMIASLAALVRKKIRLPYSIILVLLGVALGVIAEHTTAFSFIKEFELSPEMVFYVFLPTLIFESAFNLNILHFRRSFKSISFLSTITFAISIAVIAYGTTSLFGITPLVALLFGSIISSTDPVATLALFKEIGAPARLTTIIEGESLLNDGMSLVTFGIILELIRDAESISGYETVLHFGSEFLYVVLGGIVVGSLLGYIFSILISQVKNSREIEITLTLILAHTTFLFAESLIGVSGIIATMIAGMLIGNFGRHKISPSVKEFMAHFWEFAAFISNSLIFLLVGKEVITRFQAFEFFSFKTVILVTLLGLIARAVSVYLSMPFINLFNREKISMRWAHVIQWSGLRGALALALLLSLPEWIPNRDLIIFLGLTIVMSTLLINANTLSWLISKLNIQAFSLTDSFEKHEFKVIIDQNILKKLKSYYDNKFISLDTYTKIRDYYKKDENKESHFLEKLIKKAQKDGDDRSLYLMLKNHFLGIEKQIFQKLYARGEITEKLLHILINNVDEQIENIESRKKVEVAPFFLITSQNRILNHFKNFPIVKQFLKHRYEQEQTLRCEMYRARIIAINRVGRIIKDLKTNSKFKKITELKQLETKYCTWLAKAEHKAAEIEKNSPAIVKKTELYIMKKLCLQKEEIEIHKLLESNILSPKVAKNLLSDIEARKLNNESSLCINC